MSFVSLGIVLVKHMVKQSDVIFFPSDKKFESPYFIDNKLENTRIISST